jgi:hypothetical protein
MSLARDITTVGSGTLMSRPLAFALLCRDARAEAKVAIYLPNVC